MTEPENTADDGQWWQIFVDWAEDLMDQQIPASVVILILLVAAANPIYKVVMALVSKRRDGNG